jgi:hypothetical protein
MEMQLIIGPVVGSSVPGVSKSTERWMMAIADVGHVELAIFVDM